MRVKIIIKKSGRVDIAEETIKKGIEICPMECEKLLLSPIWTWTGKVGGGRRILRLNAADYEWKFFKV